MGKELLLTNVKEKLSNARNACPGMSSDLYLLTDYLSKTANDELVPSGLGVALALATYDIGSGKNGFGQELDQIYIDRKKEVLAQICYIPQVIDAIADEEYALEFRNVVKEVFDIDPPVRAKVEIDEEVPENVRVAVEWWANAIQSPRYGSSVNPLVALFAMNNRQSRSEEEVNTFKDALTKEILNSLEQFNRCDLDVDYHACPLLMRAGSTIGLDDMLDFPCKTRMRIDYNVVEVCESGQYTTLWQAQGIEKELK